MKSTIAILLLGSLLVSTQAQERLRCWVCNNVQYNSQCLATGFVRRCRPNSVCQSVFRRVGSGGSTRIFKGCRDDTEALCPADSQPDVWFPDRCNMRDDSDGPCRCCCRDEVCNRDQLGCYPQPTCSPVEPIENGAVAACDQNTLPSGRYPLNTRCNFTCNEGFEISQSSATYGTCRYMRDTTDFAWFEPSGTVCVERIDPTCTPPQRPENGGFSCRNQPLSDGTYSFGTVCDFFCNPGYVIGPGFTSTTECRFQRDTTEFALFDPGTTVCVAEDAEP